MAVVKIKTIKNNLEAVINYAQNGDKTENGILVTGVNCVPQTAYNQMALTKKFFHKESGRQGYHIIQSFNGKEVSPNEANEIGTLLAEELFGDKFQAVICTHINKYNVHNHIVLNSVSFVDGSKYHNSKLDIALIKDKSDELCKEYEISVIQTTKANKTNKIYEKRISKYNRSSSKMLQVKVDIDDAIIQSKKMSEFYDNLKIKGYETYKRGMYLSVKSPYFARNIRLERAFGEEYSLHNIQDRIYYGEKDENQKKGINKKYYRKVYKGPKIDSFKLKFSQFYRSYVRWLYKLGKLPPKVEYEELTPEYFKQRKETQNILDEISFIARNNINNIQDFENCEEWLSVKLTKFKGERENLWRQYNKVKLPKDKFKIKMKIDSKTCEINAYSNELKICRRFMWRQGILKEEANILKTQEISKGISKRNKEMIR